MDRERLYLSNLQLLGGVKKFTGRPLLVTNTLVDPENLNLYPW